jgi:hypothetical protein
LTLDAIGLEAARARLTEIERDLARLQHRHDIAMSAFLFEEATVLGRTIAALDRERQALAADLPAPPAEPERGIVPALARPRRRRARRR